MQVPPVVVSQSVSRLGRSPPIGVSLYLLSGLDPKMRLGVSPNIQNIEYLAAPPL